jgi:glyoxylase-like metal-dependent hydrolase (beta-lactamase superfamily II)
MQQLKSLHLKNPISQFISEKVFEYIPVSDNDRIKVGEYELTCISTPGHTPGHMCLYDEGKKIMFTGDHVLFDITPNITVWTQMPDPLASYIDSLEKLKGYDVELTLTGHRGNAGGFSERVKGLISHHMERLEEVKQIIREYPGINGYNVAANMHWSIRAKNWREFPETQRWFAVGEALAHLKYLVNHSGVNMEVLNGEAKYFISE